MKKYIATGLILVVVATSIGYLLEYKVETKSTVATSNITSTLTSKEVDSTTDISNPNVDEVNTPKILTFKVENIVASADSIVYFNVPVVDESVNAAIEILDDSKAKVIYLILNSPGGSVLAGARLLAYMKNSGKNIVTVCDNICASMAFQIFELGSRRLMTEKAILMAHPASGGTQGTLENMYSQLTMFKLYVDRMDLDTATRSGIEYSKFKAMVSNNIWAETPEALKLRLADGIVNLKVLLPRFSSKGPSNLLNILKKDNKWTDEMSKVKGYYLN